MIHIKKCLKIPLNYYANRFSGRSSNGGDPIYEDFGSCASNRSSSRQHRGHSQSPSPSNSSLASLGHNSFGTTFVELIKRPGTKLGVSVSGSLSETGSAPEICGLTVGSWAQRSDVLCLGDQVVGVNGADATNMTEAQLALALDGADRVQLEVR